MKTYADYLAQGNNINKALLAPLNAQPKYSRGDHPKSRFNRKMDQEYVENSDGKFVLAKDLERTRGGYLLRKKIE